jgi:exodeoxyribonuclease-3
MKLISWNVNGLRAAIKKGFTAWLHAQNADIIGIQEIKADIEQLPNEIINPEESGSKMYAYFSSSRTKKGYSGVALFCKNVPDKVDYGMGIEKFDDEGRYIAVHFKDIVIINCYFPNGGGGPERLAYKLDFYDAFLSHIEEYKRQGKKIIFMGDVNTAHNEIDLARPKQNEKNTGFLPIEREWIDQVVSLGYIDTFRYLYPMKLMHTHIGI